jgi:NitT/TauT family transport system ATP-binding protein
MSEVHHHIRAGFLPLMDSALLIVAREKGFAEAEGIELTLVRENSWANIRDRLVVGHFDVAHMLAPMPIAATLKLNPLSSPMIAPLAMGLGGNAVTVSRPVWEALAEYGAPADLKAREVGEALKRVVAANLLARKLRFAVVHPHSGHNYELRYWLTASGIRPDHDVEIVILPPPLMADALSQGTIDGYCVGEPWNTIGVLSGAGRIATVKAEIWRSSPEKVLGMTAQWAEAHPETVAALVRAIYRASEWCGDTANLEAVADILSRPDYLNVETSILLRGLSGHLLAGPEEEVHVENFFVPHAKAATFPWQSHALWFYSQMVRWGQAAHSAENAGKAMACFRPDLYRSALTPLGAPVPGANSKVEGALTRPTPVGVTKGRLTLGPDGFFDGDVFDPDALDSYISGQSEHRNA